MDYNRITAKRGFDCDFGKSRYRTIFKDDGRIIRCVVLNFPKLFPDKPFRNQIHLSPPWSAEA